MPGFLSGLEALTQPAPYPVHSPHTEHTMHWSCFHLCLPGRHSSSWTYEERVLKVLTNVRGILRVLTNEKRVLPALSPASQAGEPGVTSITRWCTV